MIFLTFKVSNAVASQVVFIDGVPAKQHYRHYKIKNPTVTIGHSDDFASMAEVIGRRFRKYQTSPPTPQPLPRPLSCEERGEIPAEGGNAGRGEKYQERGEKLGDDFPDLVMIDGGKRTIISRSSCFARDEPVRCSKSS